MPAPRGMPDVKNPDKPYTDRESTSFALPSV